MMSTTKAEKKVQFQEVPDEDDASSVSSINEQVELDAIPSKPTDKQAPSSQERVLSRNEKKARKVFSKMNMKRVEGILRVAIRRGKVIFAIDAPEVYKIVGSDQYVVFGEARAQDPIWHSQAYAAQQQAAAEHQAQLNIQRSADSTGKDTGNIVVEEEQGEEGAEGLDEKDIEMVMDQANVSRNAAIRGLKKNNNDIVNAIMELTM